MVSPSFSLRVKRLNTGSTKLHSLSFVGDSLKKRAPLSAFFITEQKKTTSTAFSLHVTNHLYINATIGVYAVTIVAKYCMRLIRHTITLYSFD